MKRKKKINETINLDKETFYQLALMAHEKEVTATQMLNDLLLDFINKIQAMKKKDAKKFINSMFKNEKLMEKKQNGNTRTKQKLTKC